MVTKVIAEIGVNWRHLAEADIMIAESAAAGASICKFQAYPLDLFKPGTQLATIALKPDDMRYLYYRCENYGVEFMCTPMYPEAVPLLDPYVKRWKIRHCDKDNQSILIPCALTKKPMLVSGRNLYCVPEYPPTIKPIETIPFPYIGVSSHYPTLHTVVKWSEQGLDFIEVHVKRDIYYDGWCAPDNHVSLNMTELGLLCEHIGEYYCGGKHDDSFSDRRSGFVG